MPSSLLCFLEGEHDEGNYVIGLGIMGFSMADNFLKIGYERFVFNQEPDESTALEERGDAISDLPVDVAVWSETLVMMVKPIRMSTLWIWVNRV